MNKFIPALLVGIMLFVGYVGLGFAQEGPERDPLDMKSGKSQYFKIFQENIYQEDQFVEEVKDKAKASSYFRVFFNDRKKPETAGFYTTKVDSDTRQKIVKLTQHVNRDRIPYYLITYKYSEEDADLIKSKVFKNLSGKVLSTYNYLWDIKTKKLLKLERYGLTPYLNQMELKSFYEMKWNGEKLKTISFYGKSKMPVEKYTFSDSVNLKQPLTTDIPEFAIGNNRIYIGNLKRYDRFKVGSDKEKTYYIEYKTEGSGMVEEKYNSDGVLLEEKHHKELPKSEVKEASSEAPTAESN